jgi:hypothetical protein
MYNRKQTFMSISFKINTQRETQNHEFESTSSINSNIYTWVFLHSSLRSPLLNALNYVTIHSEGVYIPFPSCAFKQYNLELNSIYFTLTILNASYLLRTRTNGSRSDYIIQVCLILMAHLRWCNNLREFQKLCWRLSSCLPLL